jgi:hypothetical protein
MSLLEHRDTSPHSWLQASVPLNIRNNYPHREVVANRVRKFRVGKATPSSTDGGLWRIVAQVEEGLCLESTLAH